MADLNPSQSTLSPNFAPFVYDYLSRGQAAANLPFQPFMGQRFAGPAALQNQAFSGLGSLQTPGQFQTATNMLTQAGMQAQGMGYNPTQFGNFYQAPSAFQSSGLPSYGQVGASNVSSGYQAPTPYQPTSFQNRFQGPTPYQGQTAMSGFNLPSPYQSTDFTQGIGGQSYGPSQFQTGLGPVKSLQDYMNQYTGNVSDIAAREATRQADVSRTAEQGRLAQAGAFGGARQAIMEAERQRNLGTQIGDIRSKGLQEAFDRAQQQRMQEAGLGLQAQQATEGSKQFGASFGQQGLAQLLQARQMGEASRQFGAQQAMTGATTGAQLGLQAQQQTAQDRQFAAQQAMQAQNLQAQFGLSADQAAEASRQFASGQGMTAAQIQAQYGLDAQKANQMAQMQAQQSNQRAALEAAQQAEASRQYGYGQQMTGAEAAARYGLSGAQQTEASKQFGAQYGMDALRQQLAAAQGLSGVGTAQFGTQLQGLESLLRAGGVQRDIAQQPLDFGYQQFQDSLKYPMQQAQYMQSLMQGLPVQARAYNDGASGISSAMQGGLSGLALYQLLMGGGPR